MGLLKHILTLLRSHTAALSGTCPQSCGLLQMLIRNRRDFGHPYSSPTQDVLLCSLQAHLSNTGAKVDAGATLPLLEAIGDQTSIFAVEVDKEYVVGLVLLLVPAAQQPAADHIERRVATLRALTRVIQHSIVVLLRCCFG